MLIQQSFEIYCEGNPYTNKTPLKSIVSSALIPQKAKQDILISNAMLGQKQYEDFVEDRLLKESQMYIWN